MIDNVLGRHALRNRKFQPIHAVGGAPASQWWLQGGVSSADVFGAWQGIRAGSLADSLVNLNAAGTNDLTYSNAPAHIDGIGWQFNGSDQFLNTGFTTTDSNVTALALLTNPNAIGSNLLAQAVFGARNGTDFAFVRPSYDASGTCYYHGTGSVLQPGSGAQIPHGVLGYAGKTAIRNAAADGAISGAAGGAVSFGSVPYYIGGYNNNGTFAEGMAFYVSAFVVYSTVLTVAQWQAVASAMLGLYYSPDPTSDDLYDSFQTPDSGWNDSVSTTYYTADYRADYPDHHYEIASLAGSSGQLNTELAPDTGYTDYEVEVKCQWDSGSADDGLMALVFDSNDAKSQFYYVAIYTSIDRVRVYWRDGGSLTRLYHGQDRGYVVDGENTITVRRVGARFDVLVNGVPVYSATGESRQSGKRVGVMMACNPANEVATATFDDFRLTESALPELTFGEVAMYEAADRGFVSVFDVADATDITAYTPETGAFVTNTATGTVTSKAWTNTATTANLEASIGTDTHQAAEFQLATGQSIIFGMAGDSAIQYLGFHIDQDEFRFRYRNGGADETLATTTLTTSITALAWCKFRGWRIGNRYYGVLTTDSGDEYELAYTDTRYSSSTRILVATESGNVLRRWRGGVPTVSEFAVANAWPNVLLDPYNAPSDYAARADWSPYAEWVSPTGSDPTWTANQGWTDIKNNPLDTGWVPTKDDFSFFVGFDTDTPTSDPWGYLCYAFSTGYEIGVATRNTATNKLRFYKGGLGDDANQGPKFGVIGMAADTGYLNGVGYKTGIGTSFGAPTANLEIGHSSCNTVNIIKSFVSYDVGLGESQALAAQNALEQLAPAPWRAGGVRGAQVEAAYTFKAANNITHALRDKHTPYSDDATAASGSGTWNATDGLVFANDWVASTGIVPESGWSLIVFISETESGSVSAYCVGNSDTDCIRLRPNRLDATGFQNGASRSDKAGTAFASGSLAVAGDAAYIDGVSQELSLAAWSGTASNAIAIGSRLTNGSELWTGKVQAVFVFNDELSADQVLAIHNAYTS